MADVNLRSLSPNFTSPCIITCYDFSSQVINSNIKFLITAWKAGTLISANSWLALWVESLALGSALLVVTSWSSYWLSVKMSYSHDPCLRDASTMFSVSSMSLVILTYYSHSASGKLSVGSRGYEFYRTALQTSYIFIACAFGVSPARKSYGHISTGTYLWLSTHSDWEARLLAPWPCFPLSHIILNLN